MCADVFSGVAIYPAFTILFLMQQILIENPLCEGIELGTKDTVMSQTDACLQRASSPGGVSE